MPRFRYRALDARGQPQDSELDAADPAQALSVLQGRGLMVLRLGPVHSPRSRLWRRPLINGAALAQLTGQLATLLDAGQPLDRALGLLIGQAQRPDLRRLLERLRERVKGGQPLSAALAEEGDTFSPLYIALVRAGELGGALDVTLAQLAVYLERADALRGEVINALIYPAFLIVGVLGSLALLMAYVVPQFVPIFADLGVPIPALTEAVLWLGQALAAQGQWLLLGMGTLAVGTQWRLRDPAARLRLDQRLLGAPLAGPLLQRLECARLARTLGTLLGNGVALLTALDIAAQACRNRALHAALRSAAARVKDGGGLAPALGASGLLPELAVQMVEVGEQSGQLERLLLKTADIFDSEARRSIARLLAALVPSLTLVMAVLVAFIMLAIMLPLMSLTSNL